VVDFHLWLPGEHWASVSTWVFLGHDCEGSFQMMSPLLMLCLFILLLCGIAAVAFVIFLIIIYLCEKLFGL